jgi:hypothetical protein
VDSLNAHRTTLWLEVAESVDGQGYDHFLQPQGTTLFHMILLATPDSGRFAVAERPVVICYCRKKRTLGLFFLSSFWNKY